MCVFGRLVGWCVGDLLVCLVRCLFVVVCIGSRVFVLVRVLVYLRVRRVVCAMRYVRVACLLVSLRVRVVRLLVCSVMRFACLFG